MNFPVCHTLSPFVMQLDYITTRVAPVLSFWLTFWQTDRGTGRKAQERKVKMDSQMSCWSGNQNLLLLLMRCVRGVCRGHSRVPCCGCCTCCCCSGTWKLCEYDLCGQSAVISFRAVWVEVAQRASMGSSPGRQVVVRSSGRLLRRRCRRICAIKVEHIITQIARLATKCRGGKVTKEGGVRGSQLSW